MPGRVIPIFFASAEWLLFLYSIDGIEIRHVTSFQVGSERFRDFRAENFVLRVLVQQQNRTGDQLEEVLSWIKEDKRKKIAERKAEQRIPVIVG